MSIPARTERNSAVTTAPARPVLLGPNGKAIERPAPRPAGDWQPVRAAGNAVVWERPMPTVTVERADAPAPQTTARDDAAAVLADARTMADRIIADAETEADQVVAEAKSLRARTLAAADHDAKTIRDRAAADTARAEEKGKQADAWMARAVIVGAVGLTATGEYLLARLAHFPWQVAWLLPFVIDVYVIQAFRRHRDILQAIALTIAANVAYHLASAGMFGVTTDVHGEHHAKWWLIALVASIASVILWRMHVITAPPKTKKTPGTGPSPAPVEGAPGTGADLRGQGPVPAPSAAPAPVAEPVPSAPPVPAVRAVPKPTRKAVQRGRSAAPRKPRSTASSTASKTGTEVGTGSFDEHVEAAREWLTDDPGLSGTDIGKRLGTGDSYGRRVKRAATTATT